MSNYMYYVSFPIISKMVDLTNQDEVNLINYFKSIKDKVRTKSECAKLRRLMKKALGDSGLCGMHFIDLSFRKCRYAELDTNECNLPLHCKWCSVDDVK